MVETASSKPSIKAQKFVYRVAEDQPDSQDHVYYLIKSSKGNIDEESVKVSFKTGECVWENLPEVFQGEMEKKSTQ